MKTWDSCIHKYSLFYSNEISNSVPSDNLGNMGIWFTDDEQEEEEEDDGDDGSEDWARCLSGMGGSGSNTSSSLSST